MTGVSVIVAVYVVAPAKVVGDPDHAMDVENWPLLERDETGVPVVTGAVITTLAVVIGVVVRVMVLIPTAVKDAYEAGP